MERNREARRASMVAVNVGGLSRRRQRSGSLRDSPEEEDGAVEFAEVSRLRDRTSKRDRERDRSSRSKRRRGDRLIHGGGGGGRNDGEDSSDESVDDEEDEEEDDQSVSLRTLAHPPPTMNQPISSSASQQNSHSRRSIPPARPVRLPPVWKVADEMIGVQIPRKARSASGKRSQESLISSSSCGGGEQILRQSSTSPARPSSTSTAHNSPSSCSVSVKKKLLIGGGSLQQRPPKAASKPQAQDKIEIDVAEVLFKMARQFECNPPKQDNHKLESKDANGSLNNEVKSRVSSPISQPSSNAFSNQGTSAPKRKRPRLINYEEDNAAALPSSSAKKMEPTEQAVKSEASSPKLDKLADSSKCAPDPVTSDAAGAAASSLADAENDSGVKHENVPKPDLGGGDQTESENVPRSDLDVKFDESDNKFESEQLAEKPPAKLIIDLMEPPPGKSSSEREDQANDINKSFEPQIELAQQIEDSGNGEKMEPKRNQEEMLLGDGKKLEPTTDDFDVKEQKREGLDLQLDLEKPTKEILATSKNQSQKQQQPKGSTKSASKADKPGSPAVSMPLPLPVSGWSGNLNPFGYMGQVSSLPPVFPVDERSGSSKSVIPPQRPKRCATHCYIAKSINYYQQLTKLNACWPTAAGAMQFYGAKPYNLNVVPPESAIHNSLQGNLQGRSLSAMPEKVGTSVGNGYLAPPAGDKSSTAGNSVAEAQRKQLMLQQIPQLGSANTMLHGPAFMYPLNQHTAGPAAASTHPAAPKSAAGTSSASSASANIGATNTASGGGSAGAVNFNFTSLPPNEAQYFAILQNNGYPFPIPAHVTPYRGASPVLSMPFFSGSFYSSQMIHSAQLQQQPVGQQAHHAQQGHQNTSTSSGSSSSQKLQQKSKRVPGAGGVTGGSSKGLPSSKQHQHTAEVKQDSPLAHEVRSSQAHKNIHGHNITMPSHPQNFSVISPAAGASALGGSGGSQNEKQQAPQTFAMSYTSLAGPTAGAAPAPPGLDFSAISQSHPVFHSLPEAARHSYQFSVAAAAAAQMAHQKKSNHHEDGKSTGEMMSASIAGEDERKYMAASKGPASGLQNSLAFSRSDGEASMSSIASTSIMDSSSRTLNLIQAASGGGRIPNRSSNSVGVPTTSSSNAIANSPVVLQQQQQILQLQKQQQQQFQMQHQLTSHPKSSERLPGSSSATKFPLGFPQALIQGGGSPSQSPQWKSSSKLHATPHPNPSPVLSSNKSQVPQHPSRVSQPNQSAPSHQTQISFGGNALKMAVGSSGRQNTLSSLSSATSVVIGSPPNTVSKGANIGSPQVSSSVKSAASAPTSLSSLPQASDRNSPSNSSLKLSSVSNRNMPSILGQPHITSVPTSTSSSNAKQQQSQTHQKQPYPQPQLFFSGAYMPSQTSQANAIAYYQRQQAELQSQHNSNPTTMGVLSLCSSATHPGTDTSKTGAAGSLKGLPAHGLLQHPGQAASGTPFPLITAAAAASFPYINSMQSVTVKPPDQKPAAGN